ncbi:Prg family repication protein PrgO [Enterococcus faecium]|nr:Prg family repication protein PrgO [Enterococcus faecium]
MANHILPLGKEIKLNGIITNGTKIREIGAEDISIKDDINVELGERKYTAKERKPVQVDPPVLKTIRDLSYAKDFLCMK